MADSMTDVLKGIHLQIHIHPSSHVPIPGTSARKKVLPPGMHGKPIPNWPVGKKPPVRTLPLKPGQKPPIRQL